MHTIRLRRPWEKQLVGSDIVSRVDVPESISDSPVTESTFVYRRRFNQPTGLDDAAKVHLRISGWSGQIDSVTLNGSSLRIAGDSIEVEVKSLLRAQNQIDIQLTDTAKASAALSGEVTLAIT